MATHDNVIPRRDLTRVYAVIVLILTLIVAAWASIQLVRRVNIVRYNDGRERLPSLPAVCPGETFTFPVVVSVNIVPAVVEVIETWCRDDGYCPYRYTRLERLGIAKEVENVVVMAKRVAPEDITPGEWTLHHVSISRVTEHNTVTGFYVPITIKDCSP